MSRGLPAAPTGPEAENSLVGSQGGDVELALSRVIYERCESADEVGTIKLHDRSEAHGDKIFDNAANRLFEDAVH